MEFAWNISKNTMGSVKGLEKEQEREGKVNNPDIDLEKTYLNYDLVIDERNLYNRIKDRVNEVRENSRVQKNSVVDCSNIITVNKDTFTDWGLDKTRQYFKETYNYFCEEFGQENVVSAKVHLDETTPHMHLHFVPISEENKLQARKVVTRERINRVHEKAPKYFKSKGFEVERGAGKTKENLEIHNFKAKKLKEEINKLETQYDNRKKDIDKLDLIENIDVKKTWNGRISISQSNFDILKNNYKKCVLLEKEKEDLRAKNKDLKKDITDFLFKETTHNITKKRYKRLEDEHKDLKQEKDKLKKEIDIYKKFLNEKNQNSEFDIFIAKIREDEEKKKLDKDRKDKERKEELEQFANRILKSKTNKLKTSKYNFEI